MNLFKKQPKELGSLFDDSELATLDSPAAADYNSVIEYLTGLSDKDYDTVCKVAVIYRKAQQEVADTLGVANEPAYFINQPELPENTELVPHDVNHIEPKSKLNDEDDADIAAILDEPDFIEEQPKTNAGKK